MKAPPFLPAREQKRIQLQVRALQRARDRFETRLLPTAARTAILEDFVAGDDAGVVQHERLALGFGPEHEGRVAVASPGDRDWSLRRSILDQPVL